MKRLFILLITVSVSLAAVDFEFSGNVAPMLRWQPSDNSELELPSRIFNGKATITMGNLDWVTSANVETRWQNLDTTNISIDECYLHWFPRFGEVRLGKMIHTWGAADQNNPTDNLSAYNLYYLFETGVDRKIGSWGTEIIFNLERVTVEGIINFKHQGNILPLNEPDFPISFGSEFSLFGIDLHKDVIEPEHQTEFGMRLRGSVAGFDVSASYFSGHDKFFSVLGVDTLSVLPYIKPRLGYRKTEIYGLDFVGFLGDLTLRGEGAYFVTSNDMSFDYTVPWKAEYAEYVLQAEYPAPMDVNLSAQYIGRKVVTARGTGGIAGGSIDFTLLANPIMRHMILTQLTASSDVTDSFTPGTGMPFLNFIKNGISLSASKMYLDDMLEIKLMSLVDVDTKGGLAGISADYFMNNSIECLFSYNYFSSSDKSSFFYMMRDFSHVRFEVKYSF